MAKIGASESDNNTRAQNARREINKAEEQISELIADIRKGRAHVADLARIDVKALNDKSKAHLMDLAAEKLRGQIPAQYSQSLKSGSANTALLERLVERMANAESHDISNRFSRAETPAAARLLATDASVPEQALRWTKFIEKLQNVAGNRSRPAADSNSPVAEMASLIELREREGFRRLGPGLRSPHLVEVHMKDLRPERQARLMDETFGPRLAKDLKRLGVNNPLELVKIGALPDGRSQLAKTLNISRANLLEMLMRVELLKIGAGRNGERGIGPLDLGILRQAGITMLGSLGIIKTMSREDFTALYKMLRLSYGGYKRTLAGEKTIIKRDIMHWAKTASRMPSEILLSGADNPNGRLSRAEAQELIMAWYLESLLWDRLGEARRRLEEWHKNQQRTHRDERDQNGHHDRQEDSREDEAEWVPLGEENMEYDEERSDNLMCFWITDFGADPLNPQAQRRMYVCVDPDTGAILPQSIDVQHTPSK